MEIAVTRLFVLLTLLCGKVEAGDVCKEYNIHELLVVLAAQGTKMHEMSSKVEKLNGAYQKATDALKKELQEKFQEATNALKKEVQKNRCKIKLLENKLEKGSSGEDWVMYSGSCYLFSKQNLTFSEAQNYCRQFKASLVHINDEAENTFLKSQIAGKAWIGLSDEAIEGDWRWLDNNDALEYSNWAPDEPNQYGGIEDCVAFWIPWDNENIHAWNDAPCNLALNPICEMR